MEIRNAALSANALSFSPQLPLDPKLHTFLGPIDPVPPALEILEDGWYCLRFKAPEAKRVSVRIIFEEHPLQKDENGIWSVRLPIGTGGLMPVTFLVDGTAVINPMLAIGFGASAPGNMVDLPRPGEDFYYLKQVPHGSVTHEFFPSGVTGRTESCLVYTPPGYGKGEKQYPVLYLQHGHGENEQCWFHQGKVNFIADNLIAGGLARECIIVMCCGMVQLCDEAGHRWVDMTALPRLLVEDCIPFIEERYRVLPGRENRAVAGLSMGSMHASMLSLGHPERFAWAGIFSGFVQPPSLLSGDRGFLQILRDREKVLDSYRLFFRAMGEQDFFLKDFLADRAMLESCGLSPENWPAHVERLYPGSHDWNVWRYCIRDFLTMIF